MSPIGLWASGFDYDRAFVGEAGDRSSGEAQGEAADKAEAAWRMLLGGVSATVAGRSSAGAVACTAPPLPHGRYAVKLSLHAGEWSDGVVQFLSDGHEQLKATPDEAPVLPGNLTNGSAVPSTRVLLTGVDLHGGFAYACLARPSYLAADGNDVSVVEGTYVPALRRFQSILRWLLQMSFFQFSSGRFAHPWAESRSPAFLPDRARYARGPCDRTNYV